MHATAAHPAQLLWRQRFRQQLADPTTPLAANEETNAAALRV
jgi:hypothetical protein